MSFTCTPQRFMWCFRFKQITFGSLSLGMFLSPNGAKHKAAVWLFIMVHDLCYSTTTTTTSWVVFKHDKRFFELEAAYLQVNKWCPKATMMEVFCCWWHLACCFEKMVLTSDVLVLCCRLGSYTFFQLVRTVESQIWDGGAFLSHVVEDIVVILPSQDTTTVGNYWFLYLFLARSSCSPYGRFCPWITSFGWWCLFESCHGRYSRFALADTTMVR